MTNVELIVAHTARQEVIKQNLGLTQQHLEHLEVVVENNQPKIQRITLDQESNYFEVYFPIKHHNFFLVIFINANSFTEIKWADIQAGTGVYFTASSEELSFNELQATTFLKATHGWNKGQLRNLHPNDKLRYKFSRYSFEPIPERAYDMETKLRLLLDKLEEDVEGIRRLAKLAHGGINVHQYDYAGFGSISGISLDKNTIQRLANLNLDIDFDLYASGD